MQKKLIIVCHLAIWAMQQKLKTYIEAEKVLKANPNITHAVGYSMGGSVALELQKRYPQLQTRTYSAPVVDFQMQYLKSMKPIKKDIDI